MRPLTIVAVNKLHMLAGGADIFCIKLNNALRVRGHRVVEFSTYQPGNLPSDADASFVWGLSANQLRRASRLDLARAYARGVWNAEASRQMGRLLDRIRPDVVHLHNVFYQLSHSIIKPVRRRGIPLVLTLHDYHPVCASNFLYVRGVVCEDCKCGIHHILLNRCFHNSLVASSMAFLSMFLRTRKGGYLDQIAHVVSPSRFLLDKIAEFGVPIPKHSVIPVFYEPLASGGRTASARAVVYLGQFLEQKGVRDLLAAARRTDFDFVFGGSGPLDGEIRQAAIEHDNVRHVGFVTGEDMDRLFVEALCLAVPSRWLENAPAVVLDAYARRTPVVAAAIGGIPELVEDGVTGILVPPGSLEGLIAAFEMLGRQKERASEMGEAGYQRLVKRHSVEAYVNRMEEVYQRVLE